MYVISSVRPGCNFIMQAKYVWDLSHTDTLLKHLVFESSEIIHFILVLKTMSVWGFQHWIKNYMDPNQDDW